VLIPLALLAASSWAEPSPFKENASVRLSIGQKGDSGEAKFDAQLEAFEQSVTKGMKKAKKAIDVLVRDIDLILQDAAGKTKDTTTVINQQNPSAPGGWLSPSSNAGSSYTKGELGAAGKNFWTSLMNLFKKFGSWGKAFWEQITGPGEDESPIANGINKLKTEYHEWNLGRAWDNVIDKGGKLFGALGRFAKNLFK